MTIQKTRQRVAAARARRDYAAQADALAELANDFIRAGAIGEARDALDEAAALNRREGRCEDERHCRQFSATLSRLTGDLDGARTRVRRAAALSPDGSPGAVSAAAELGEIAAAAGDGTGSAGAFGQAVRHAASVHLNPEDRAGLLRKYGAALASAGDPYAAVAALDEATSVLEGAGDAGGSLRAAVEAVTILQNAGLPAEADDRRSKTFTRARLDGDEHVLADLELLESAAALDRGDADAALAAAERGRDHALKARAPISYVSAAFAMAELYDKRGDRLEAYSVLASGYVTLGDLLGPEVGRETFAPKLRACRERWGREEFVRIKSQYEARRRSRSDGEASP